MGKPKTIMIRINTGKWNVERQIAQGCLNFPVSSIFSSNSLTKQARSKAPFRGIECRARGAEA